ncbi:MAG TPA: hypothetical protein VLK84_29820, partial [Longimicrobium sp.]|nr:hypothetical protein [Longimicrobium sp.]
GEEGPGTFQAELGGGGGERILLVTDTIMARAPREPWQVIRAGQTVRGALAPDDAESSQWGAFDTFLYAGDPGTPIVVRVEADSLQPVLQWGAMVGGLWVPVEEEASEIATEEFGQDGLAVTPRTMGDYGFRVTGGGGQQGSYTVTVEPGRAPARLVDWLPRLEREGEVAGRLQAGDSMLAPPQSWAGNTSLDPIHYDTYAFFAVAGDRLTLTMRSAELAPVLWIGTVEGGTFVPLKSSTISGAGEAVLRFIPAEHGDYVVRAASLAPRKEGAYTIRTDDAFPDPAPGR